MRTMNNSRQAVLNNINSWGDLHDEEDIQASFFWARFDASVNAESETIEGLDPELEWSNGNWELISEPSDIMWA